MPAVSQIQKPLADLAVDDGRRRKMMLLDSWVLARYLDRRRLVVRFLRGWHSLLAVRSTRLLVRRSFVGWVRAVRDRRLVDGFLSAGRMRAVIGLWSRRLAYRREFQLRLGRVSRVHSGRLVGRCLRIWRCRVAIYSEYRAIVRLWSNDRLISSCFNRWRSLGCRRLCHLRLARRRLSRMFGMWRCQTGKLKELKQRYLVRSLSLTRLIFVYWRLASHAKRLQMRARMFRRRSVAKGFLTQWRYLYVLSAGAAFFLRSSRLQAAFTGWRSFSRRRLLHGKLLAILHQKKDMSMMRNSFVSIRLFGFYRQFARRCIHSVKSDSLALWRDKVELYHGLHRVACLLSRDVQTYVKRWRRTFLMLKAIDAEQSLFIVLKRKRLRLAQWCALMKRNKIMHVQSTLKWRKMIFRRLQMRFKTKVLAKRLESVTTRRKFAYVKKWREHRLVKSHQKYLLSQAEAFHCKSIAFSFFQALRFRLAANRNHHMESVQFRKIKTLQVAWRNHRMKFARIQRYELRVDKFRRLFESHMSSSILNQWIHRLRYRVLLCKYRDLIKAQDRRILAESFRNFRLMNVEATLKRKIDGSSMASHFGIWRLSRRSKRFCRSSWMRQMLLNWAKINRNKSLIRLQHETILSARLSHSLLTRLWHSWRQTRLNHENTSKKCLAFEKYLLLYKSIEAWQSRIKQQRRLAVLLPFFVAKRCAAFIKSWRFCNQRYHIMHALAVEFQNGRTLFKCLNHIVNRRRHISFMGVRADLLPKRAWFAKIRNVHFQMKSLEAADNFYTRCAIKKYQSSLLRKLLTLKNSLNCYSFFILSIQQRRWRRKLALVNRIAHCGFVYFGLTTKRLLLYRWTKACRRREMELERVSFIRHSNIFKHTFGFWRFQLTLLDIQLTMAKTLKRTAVFRRWRKASQYTGILRMLKCQKDQTAKTVVLSAMMIKHRRFAFLRSRLFVYALSSARDIPSVAKYDHSKLLLQFRKHSRRLQVSKLRTVQMLVRKHQAYKSWKALSTPTLYRAIEKVFRKKQKLRCFKSWILRLRSTNWQKRRDDLARSKAAFQLMRKQTMAVILKKKRDIQKASIVDRHRLAATSMALWRWRYEPVMKELKL